MKKVIVLNKEIGETPLEALEKFRKLNPGYSTTPMTYAGRLDPMAEGVLIVLTGDECKNKEKYTGLDKEYEIEVLLGVKTDSLDVLGHIQRIDADKPKEIDVMKYIGKFAQEYPKYSSKRIAKDFEEVEPKEVEIYSIENLGEREVSGEEIAKTALERISKVNGDFRQEEIAEDWQDFAREFSTIDFKIIKLRVKCSSGTYMRSLAEKMGGLAYSIRRTSVAEYKIS